MIKPCSHPGCIQQFETDKPGIQYCPNHRGRHWEGKRRRMSERRKVDNDRQKFIRDYGRDLFVKYSPFIPSK